MLLTDCALLLLRSDPLCLNARLSILVPQGAIPFVGNSPAVWKRTSEPAMSHQRSITEPEDRLSGTILLSHEVYLQTNKVHALKRSMYSVKASV